MRLRDLLAGVAGWVETKLGRFYGGLSVELNAEGLFGFVF